MMQFKIITICCSYHATKAGLVTSEYPLAQETLLMANSHMPFGQEKFTISNNLYGRLKTLNPRKFELIYMSSTETTNSVSRAEVDKKNIKNYSLRRI